MLQLFLQTSAITAADWDKVYPQIVELAGAFPLQLIQIEAYDGFERDKQDKDHFDLVVNRGQIDEHLELLKRCTSPEEKLFYLIRSVRERYKVPCA